jgi:hypothetical protein
MLNVSLSTLKSTMAVQGASGSPYEIVMQTGSGGANDFTIIPDGLLARASETTSESEGIS